MPNIPSNPDEEFGITLPAEARWEGRIAAQHAHAHWRQKLILYGFRCAYCGIPRGKTKLGYLTREHIKPVTRGGTDDIDNVVPACWPCNSSKSTQLPGELCLTVKGRLRKVPEPRIRKRYHCWY